MSWETAPTYPIDGPGNIDNIKVLHVPVADRHSQRQPVLVSQPTADVLQQRHKVVEVGWASATDRGTGVFPICLEGEYYARGTRPTSQYPPRQTHIQP